MMKTLSFPLYHSTSSIFETSIKEFGLGGKNIIKEYKVIELLKELEAIADNTITEVNDWGYFKNVISRITNQDKLFEHGDVYLTPCLWQARNYANNKYGSEAISESYRLINLLKREKIELPDSIYNKYSLFFNLDKVETTPTIFRINDLDKDFLLSTEDGDSDKVQNYINKIEETIAEYGVENYDPYVQNLNFRVAKPIPWEIVIK